jgi:hypothetical protein
MYLLFIEGDSCMMLEKKCRNTTILNYMAQTSFTKDKTSNFLDREHNQNIVVWDESIYRKDKRNKVK